jgi:integrase
MASSYLEVGQRVARQALIERPSYSATDADLDPIFGESSETTLSPTIRDQFFTWIDELKRSNPSPATLAAFTSRSKTVLQLVGNVPLADFRNAAMKKFVQDCAKFEWSPSTLADHCLVIKLIIASAVSAEGEPLYPREWNSKFIGAPAVMVSAQRRFVFTREQIETLLQQAKTPQEKLFYALSAATGMRLGEIRSIRIHGNDSQTSWEPGKIIVRTAMFRNADAGRTKTEAGRRAVYLHSSIDHMIAAFAKDREPGALLFQSRPGEPLKVSTLADRLARIIPGATHHGFRRFHISHCREARMLEEILKLRVGHASVQSITDLYSQQSSAKQAQAAEEAGLGFKLE